MSNNIQAAQPAPSRPNVDPQAAALARRMDTVKGLCERARKDLAAALPKHLTVERMLKVFYLAVSRTPGLLECSPLSLLMALMQASETGLEPNTPLQHAYLIPRNNKKTRQKEAHFMPSYRGLVHLAMQSGRVRSIEAIPVFQRDHFMYKRTLEGRVFEHAPFFPDVLQDDQGAYADERVGPLRLVYAIARLVEAEPLVETMTRAQIEGIRQRSGSPDEGPWVTDFDEMARKTVIRRISKHLPASTERYDEARRLANALEVQAAHEEGRSPIEVVTGESTAQLLAEASAIPGVVEEPAPVQVQVPANAPVEAKGPAAEPPALPASQTPPVAVAAPAAAQASTKRAEGIRQRVAKPQQQAAAPVAQEQPAAAPESAPTPPAAAPGMDFSAMPVGSTVEVGGVRYVVEAGPLGKVGRVVAATADPPPEREPGMEG